MQTYDDIGVGVPEILLPKSGVNLHKWAVIACDQFTSEPEYWHQVRALVGQAPSTLHLVFPEIDLEEPGKEQRILKIQHAMQRYLDEGLLKRRKGMMYVRRQVGNRVRQGLVLCLDLERYDYTQGSSNLIRATEGTIVERLPPRMAIREGAALELPHILVLIDDPERTVIEPVGAGLRGRRPLYDFELMLESGQLTGFGLEAGAEEAVVSALRALARPEAFRRRYNLETDAPVLLFAMGDGNHSLATAKAVWEKIKPQVGMQHPARYALVEVENVHDEGLEFEPIHRVLFDLKSDLSESLRARFGANVKLDGVGSMEAMIGAVDSALGGAQVIGLVEGQGDPKYSMIEVAHPASNLPVGTLQGFLDGFMREGGASRIDYVHGAEVVERLGSQPGNAGFYLPKMGKSSLFRTVILDGALPRKTFSMGQAREKRFYMEARKIG